MKTLTLLRHAKSTWDDPNMRDFDRPLNARGRRAAAAIGREMRDRGMRFDWVIASPAVRVIQTIEGATGAFGPINADHDKRVYLGSAAALMELLLELPDKRSSVLMVGHNPGLETLALMLTAEAGNPLREQIATKYPTGALARISLPVMRWGDLVAGIGKVEGFIRPRDLDPSLGPDGDSF